MCALISASIVASEETSERAQVFKLGDLRDLAVAKHHVSRQRHAALAGDRDNLRLSRVDAEAAL